MNEPARIQGKGVRSAALYWMAAIGLVSWLVAGAGERAHAGSYQGTVHFQGQVVFAAPIPGINAEDLEISVGSTAEATGPGESCSILSTTSDNPDTDGTYPGLSGDVGAEILIDRGGPHLPEGACIITVEASGTDGVSVSARGTQTLFVTAAEIDSAATVAVDDITVRESKAVAGLEKDCYTWIKKQLRKRRKCNILLLKGGAAFAEKCTDGGPEPAGCDPGGHLEAILALSHGVNDQQTAPESAEAIDLATLKGQFNCQNLFGKAAMTFAFKRLKLVWSLCVAANDNSEDCRSSQSQASKPTLDKIDRCGVDQAIDGATGRPVPDVGSPCDPCIDGAGVINRKCLKDCFQVAVGELTDGIIGDVSVCGNGIVQPGEFCDDGNLTPGDCCDELCRVELGVPEGPEGDPTCSDGLDNDCDGATDGADTDCQPAP